MSELNPRTHHLEFGGTFGTLAITIGLGFIIEWLYFSCNSTGCTLPTAKYQWVDLWTQAKQTSLISWQAFYAYTYWLMGLVIAEKYIGGKVVQGTLLRNNTRLEYKFNGRRVMGILGVLLVFRWFISNGTMPELRFVYDHLIELANITILYSIVISTWLYLRSFTQESDGSDRLLALGGNSGLPFYDWFIGRELNPRLGGIDIKCFLEMRPGLQLWSIINLAMAHHQYEKIGYVTDSMLMVCIFQIYYVVEGIWWEEGLVSMIDITTDGLGYMLVFGDLSLVPFTYTVQARYLADHQIDLGWFKCIAILTVYFFGLWIFRSSNNEKARFKRGDERTKSLTYLQTPTGSKLITSGWWGTARHINYTGDWIMSIAYSLVCLNAFIPYYYVFFFAGLLIHREQRDEAKCAEKYKETWTEYKKKVPYRFIPGVY